MFGRNLPQSAQPFQLLFVRPSQPESKQRSSQLGRAKPTCTDDGSPTEVDLAGGGAGGGGAGVSECRAGPR